MVIVDDMFDAYIEWQLKQNQTQYGDEIVSKKMHL